MPALLEVLYQLRQQREPFTLFGPGSRISRGELGCFSEIAPILLIGLDNSRFHQVFHLAFLVASVVPSMRATKAGAFKGDSKFGRGYGITKRREHKRGTYSIKYPVVDYGRERPPSCA